MTARIPLTIVYPGPSPHAVDFFSALQHHGSFDLEVLFCLPGFITRGGWPLPKMDFRHEFLPSRRLLASSEFAIWNSGLVERVRAGAKAGRVHLLSGGYTIPAVALSMVALNRLRAQWYFHSEKPGISSNRIKTIIRNRLIRSCLKHCTKILAYSPIAAATYEQMGFSSSMIRFLPYYMNIEEFGRINRSWSALETRPLRILYFGQLHPIKGIDWAVRTLTGLRNAQEKFEFSIAGDGPLRSTLTEYVTGMNLPNVRFLGQIPWDRRWECFADHDLLLLPSQHDGWGMVVMEALASGMPVIGSENSGAVQAYVRDGINGLRIPYGNDTALRDALVRCINSRSEVAAWGKNARETISDWRPEIGGAKLHAIIQADRN